MNRRELMLAGMALGVVPAIGCSERKHPVASAETASKAAPGSPPTILLNDYLPHSIYKIPVTIINKAKYPAIDWHCHGHGPLNVGEMVKIMDKVGVEKTVIYTGAQTPERFTAIRREYDQYPSRFVPFCLLDLRGYQEPGFKARAIKALEGCHRAGARGIGEMVDKGKGFFNSLPLRSLKRARQVFASLNGGPTYTRAPMPPNPHPSIGLHPDDPRLDALWNRVGQLGMPVSIHVSDPIWSYQPMDYTNDGLMNGWTWRIILEPGMYDHDQLVNSLDKTVQNHPHTIFSACHLANCDYDLTRLGGMFDRHPNLYADIAARFAETATIPRFTRKFLMKYPDRVVYGTDVSYNQPFFSTTFRILESEDEHFYERGQVKSANFNFNYHWTLNGFGLPDHVLQNLYRNNVLNIFKKAQQNAA